ncbi:MAG: hypothetical protein ACRCXZ_02565 [Patescibacteria group bacterium]
MFGFALFRDYNESDVIRIIEDCLQSSRFNRRLDKALTKKPDLVIKVLQALSAQKLLILKQKAEGNSNKISNVVDKILEKKPQVTYSESLEQQVRFLENQCNELEQRIRNSRCYYFSSEERLFLLLVASEALTTGYQLPSEVIKARDQVVFYYYPASIFLEAVDHFDVLVDRDLSPVSNAMLAIKNEESLDVFDSETCSKARAILQLSDYQILSSLS